MPDNLSASFFDVNQKNILRIGILLNMLKSNLNITLAILTWITIYGCSRIDERIYGDWCTTSNYYRACYNISRVNDKIVGKVLTYDDGTSNYSFNKENPKYVFKQLIYRNEKFADGVSGATSTKEESATTTIKVINLDSIEVQTKLSKNHTTKEIWIRKKQ